MKWIKKLAWTFAAMGVLLIFIGLDWIPTLKDLNRLRREQRDEALKIRDFTVMASGFVFPDVEEKSFFAENNARLSRSLPQMYDDDAWLAMSMLELQARFKAEGIAKARVYFDEHAMGSKFDKAGPERPDPLADWLLLQYRDIQESFQFANDPGRCPWYGVFSSLDAGRRQRLASRTLAVVLAAPLPVLLDFVNRISWGETRLEIVRLRLEPRAALSRAWLICRGNYLVSKPAGREIKKGLATIGDGLLIDPDSPVLWQKVDPGIASRGKQRDLAPDSGWNPE